MFSDPKVTLALVLAALAASDAMSIAESSDLTLLQLRAGASNRRAHGQISASSERSRQAALGAATMGCGDEFTWLVEPNGDAWSSGYNGNGQLADGTSTRRNSLVMEVSGVQQVHGGNCHAVFLMDDSTVKAVGCNGNGMLGDGTRTQRSSLVQVTDGALGVYAGRFHTLVLKNDRSVLAAGKNNVGQLADGSKTDKQQLVPTVGGDGAQAIGAGSYHTLVLKSDGSLWTGGHNQHGQLGDGAFDDRQVLQQVVSGVQQASGGEGHTLILKTDGTAWAAGRNDQGQLADGTSSLTAQDTSNHKANFVQVAAGVQSVFAGQYSQHTLVLKNDATVWAAGQNNFGQLGDHTSTSRASLVQVATGVQAMSAGLYHTLVLRQDGSIRSCGQGSLGALGDGSWSNRNSLQEAVAFPTPPPTPRPTSSPQDLSAVGDPHLTNVLGDKFQIFRSGRFAMLTLPRGAAASEALLHVQAEVNQIGDRCGALFIQRATLTGSWLERTPALTFSTGGGGFVADEVVGLQVGNSSALSVAEFVDRLPAGLAHVDMAPGGLSEPSRPHLHATLAELRLSIRYGVTAKITFVHQKLPGFAGFVNALWLRFLNIGAANTTIGGLLGEDDHSVASTMPVDCRIHRAMLVGAQTVRTEIAAASLG